MANAHADLHSKLQFQPAIFCTNGRHSTCSQPTCSAHRQPCLQLRQLIPRPSTRKPCTNCYSFLYPSQFVPWLAHACTWFTRQQASIFTSSCRHRLATKAVVSPTRHAGFHPCMPFASLSKPIARHCHFHATAPEHTTSSLVPATTRPFLAMTITLSALSHAKDIPLVLHLNNHTKSSLVWL